MNCKICDNKKLNELELDEVYYHCDNCDLIFIDEDGIIDSNEEKERYAEHDNSHENTGYVNMFKGFIDKVLEPYVGLDQVEAALDFGCGPGPVLADLLKAKGISVDIYDPFFFPEKVFRGKKYDLITSTEVFEHLKNPLKELELLVGHLKEGGYLALMTSFHPGPDKFKDWWYNWDPTHITFYNHNTFEEIAGRNPLEIVFEDGDKYCLFQRILGENT